jgi:hypothetical protein
MRGPENDPRFCGPLRYYAHGSSSTTGCAIYNSGNIQFSQEYVDDYFFADYCGSWIKRFDPGQGSGATTFEAGSGEFALDLRVAGRGAFTC